MDEDTLDVLKDALGTDLRGTEKVANDTMHYFTKRADEEGLNVTEMITAIRAVEDKVMDSIEEAEEAVKD